MRASSLLLDLLISALLCHGCTLRPWQDTYLPHPVPEKSEAPLPTLSWVPGEDLLLVDSRWLFDPKSERFTPLSLPVKGARLSFSASGKKLFLQQGSLLYAGSLPALPKEPLVLPNWLKAEDPDHIAFWLSDETIYVAQQALVHHPDTSWAEVLETCRLFHISTGTWSEPKGGCIQGDFSQIDQITPGPVDRVAVYSAGEGHPAVRIDFYDPARGQREIGAPSLNLYPHGPLLAHFTTDPDRLEFTTPCILERKEPPPCDVAEEAPWRWYSWSLTQKRLTLLQKDLPYGVLPHPDGSWLAWPAPGRICVGDTVSPENTVCYPLPK